MYKGISFLYIRTSILWLCVLEIDFAAKAIALLFVTNLSWLFATYRNCLKERPGLNKRPLRISAPLCSWKIYWVPRLKWDPLLQNQERGTHLEIYNIYRGIQIVFKNDETRVFFSQIFFSQMFFIIRKFTNTFCKDF